jgi:hypothetical protein
LKIEGAERRLFSFKEVLVMFLSYRCGISPTLLGYLSLCVIGFAVYRMHLFIERISESDTIFL